jgi:hypothetical protein
LICNSKREPLFRPIAQKHRLLAKPLHKVRVKDAEVEADLGAAVPVAASRRRQPTELPPLHKRLTAGLASARDVVDSVKVEADSAEAPREPQHKPGTHSRAAAEASFKTSISYKTPMRQLKLTPMRSPVAPNNLMPMKLSSSTAA